MKKAAPVEALVDIGGVLLTDGWGHQARKLAVETFNLDLVVFYREQTVSRSEFRKFMFEQSKPQPEMINLMRKLKAKFGLKIVVVSNEGRELNDYRIQKFKLNEFVDSFISSVTIFVGDAPYNEAASDPVI